MIDFENMKSFDSFCLGRHALAFKDKTDGVYWTELLAFPYARTSKQTGLYHRLKIGARVF